MTKIDKVRAILQECAETKDKLPALPDGTIDFEHILEAPSVAKSVQELKKLGITGDWLLDRGFMPAGLIYGRLL